MGEGAPLAAEAVPAGPLEADGPAALSEEAGAEAAGRRAAKSRLKQKTAP